MDLVKELGELAIATRLKRLSERLSADVSKIYKESAVDFEARWFLMLSLLKKHKVMAITEIADSLQLSHPAIIQLVQELSKKKLIRVAADQHDGRKRMISLSAAGKNTLEQLAPVMAGIRTENRRWIEEADANLLEVLDQLERALDQQTMYQRIKLNLLR